MAKKIAQEERKPYHHGNLRRALLDEALATIRSEGVDGVTLREIGARVGVSRTALYRHFADKRALLTAVAIEGFRELRQRLTAAWEKGGRGSEAFQAMGSAYLQFAMDNPAHYRVMFGSFVEPENEPPELAEEAGGAFDALAGALQALQQGGTVRGDDPHLMARFVWSVVHGVAMLSMDGQLREAGEIEQLMRYALERLRSGIDVAGPRPSRDTPPHVMG